MFVPRFLRSKIAAALALLVVAAVVGALPTFTTAQPVSAQGDQHCNGAYVSGSHCPGSGDRDCNGNDVNGTSCPPTGNQYCNGAYITGSSCPTPGNQYCNGAYTTGSSCPTTGNQYCNGAYTTGSSCPTPGNQYCNGAYTTGSYCPTPGNQYCNGAYVTSNQYCCPNSTTYYGGYPSQSCSTNSLATYQSGWTIVSGPAGTTLSGNTGPLYTFPAGASNYTTLPTGSPLQAGVGYWAYFPSGGTANLGSASSASTSIPLPPGQFIMIGNPGSTTATVSGANALVLIFNPSTNGYSQTTQLAAGQGAWAASPTGGTLTITNSAPPPPPPPL